MDRESKQPFSAGKRIGRYRLTDTHASGGFGVVWRAEDKDLRRKVALKHLRNEWKGDAELRRRFVSEARITAQLEHPGVVPVYDIGGLENDVPYYTMRLVRGRTLEEAICEFHSERRPSQAAAVNRLRLLNALVAVARTMQYAHAQGILHRDLKPQNVVLGDFGEAIVLDWGLARLIDHDEHDSGAHAATEIAETPSDLTVPGSVKGTPAYMSPEQAAGSSGEIDERSDIYALGSILYHLLTGHLPFEGSSEEALQTKAFALEAPSPRRLDSGIPRPLDAVCRKAMAPARLDRYKSAGSFVRDIERYLADAPVDAWREPLHVRAGRFLRRHRTLMTSFVASISVVIVSLLVGVAVLSASNQRERAAHHVADQQREEAIQYFGMARQSVDRFLNAVTEDNRLKSESLEPLRKELLESSLEFYETLASKRPNDHQLLVDFASAQLRRSEINRTLGNFKEAMEAAQRAVKLIEELNTLQPETHFSRQMADAHVILGQAFSDYGRLTEATPEYEKAHAILRKAVENDPDNLEWQFGLAGALNDCGALYLEILLGHVGSDASATTYAKRARSAFSEGIQLLEDLLEAPSARQKAGRISEIKYDLATTLRNLGIVLAIEEDFDAAEDAAQRSVEIRQSLLDDAPESQEFQAGVASSLRSLAAVYMQTDRFEKAIAQYEAARTWSSKLAAQHPEVLDFQYEVAVTTINIANNHRSLDRVTEAVTELENAVKTLRRLVDAAPESIRFHIQIAHTQQFRASLLTEQGNDEAAMAAYKEVIHAYQTTIELLQNGSQESSYVTALIDDLETARRALATLQRNRKSPDTKDDG